MSFEANFAPYWVGGSGVPALSPGMSAEQINASMYGNYSPQQAQSTLNNIYGPSGFGGLTNYYAQAVADSYARLGQPTVGYPSGTVTRGSDLPAPSTSGYDPLTGNWSGTGGSAEEQYAAWLASLSGGGRGGIGSDAAAVPSAAIAASVVPRTALPQDWNSTFNNIVSGSRYNPYVMGDSSWYPSTSGRTYDDSAGLSSSTAPIGGSAEEQHAWYLNSLSGRVPSSGQLGAYDPFYNYQSFSRPPYQPTYTPPGTQSVYRAPASYDRSSLYDYSGGVGGSAEEQYAAWLNNYYNDAAGLSSSTATRGSSIPVYGGGSGVQSPLQGFDWGRSYGTRGGYNAQLLRDYGGASPNWYDPILDQMSSGGIPSQPPVGGSAEEQHRWYLNSLYNPGTYSGDQSNYGIPYNGQPQPGDIGFSRQPTYPNIGYNPGMENLFANPGMNANQFQNRFGMGFPNAGTPSQVMPNYGETLTLEDQYLAPWRNPYGNEFNQ